jgi:N-acetylglucosaminyl-diphospho-decaprenol L-rhamnosyltransferase
VWEVTIVWWRSPSDELVRAARGLALQEPPCRCLRILVAEDPDGSRAREAHQALAEVDLPVVLRSDPANPGFAAGHDLLLAEAFAEGAEVVIVHNPDLVLMPGCVQALLAHAHRGALLGPVLELSEAGLGTGLVDSLGIRWTWDSRHLDVGQGQPVPDLPPDPWPVAGVSGACLVVPRAVHEHLVGTTGELFDADFVAYREDAELALRAARLGIGCLLVPDARALHERRLRGSGRGDPHVDLLGVRNRFLIACKHAGARPGRWPGPWLRDVVVLVAAATVERSSWAGVVQAWRLRRRMAQKRGVLQRAVRGAGPPVA